MSDVAEQVEGINADEAPIAKKKSMPDKARLKQIAEYHGIRIMAYLAAFAAMDAWVVATSLPIAHVLSVITALVVGGYISGLFHEWGHFVGARITRSRSPLTATPNGVFMFGFDTAKNSPRQFLSMSFGGPIGNWLLVAFVFFLIPLDSPGRVALFAMVLGKAVAVVIFEGPIISRTMKGGNPQEELDKQLNSGALNRGQILGYLTTAAVWVLAV